MTDGSAIEGKPFLVVSEATTPEHPLVYLAYRGPFPCRGGVKE